MPNRYVREGINSSRPVASLGDAAEVFYRRMINVVDDFGRFELDTKLIRSTAYPVHDTIREADILRWFAACEKAELIVSYEINGRKFMVLTKTERPRAKFSQYPNPPPEVVDRHGLWTSANTSYHVKTFAPSPIPTPSPIPKPIPKPIPTPSGECESVMEGLRAELNKTYKRGPNDPWSNIEETTLFDISKRPEAIAELEHILIFRSKMQPDDRKRFFPQSLYALLDRWTETLDKARIQAPIKKPVAFPIKKALNEKAISIDDLKSSLEWTKANTPEAKEAIATLQRRIEEMNK